MQKVFPDTPTPQLTWAEQERFKTRTMSERVNARLKDEFGASQIRVRGAAKVMAHLMFGVLALTRALLSTPALQSGGAIVIGEFELDQYVPLAPPGTTRSSRVAAEQFGHCLFVRDCTRPAGCYPLPMSLQHGVSFRRLHLDLRR